MTSNTISGKSTVTDSSGAGDTAPDPEPSTADPDIVPGLEPLIPLKVVFAKQRIDMLEGITHVFYRKPLI